MNVNFPQQLVKGNKHVFCKGTKSISKCYLGKIRDLNREGKTTLEFLS